MIQISAIIMSLCLIVYYLRQDEKQKRIKSFGIECDYLSKKYNLKKGRIKKNV